MMLMDSEIVPFKAITSTESTAGCCFSTDYSCEFLVVMVAIFLWFTIEIPQNIYNLHAITFAGDCYLF